MNLVERFFLCLFLALSAPCWGQASDNGRVNVGHKAAHFTIGFGVAWGFGLGGHHKTGLALGVGLGLAKEYYDHKHSDETWSSQKRDIIIITSAGAVLGYFVAKHYYPDGLDLSDGHRMTLWQQEQEDIRLQAEFKSWEQVRGSGEARP